MVGGPVLCEGRLDQAVKAGEGERRRQQCTLACSPILIFASLWSDDVPVRLGLPYVSM